MDKRILYFEGAGWEEADSSKATDVGNCRIRTVFTNKKAESIYLELSCTEVGKRSSPRIKYLTYAGFVTDCFFVTGDDDDCNKHGIVNRNSVVFEYNRENILSYVNSLGCDFDEVMTLPYLAGYHVHSEHGGYNYGDKFVYDEGLLRRRKAIDRYYYDLEKSEGKEFPNHSTWVDEDNPDILHLLRHFNGYNRHWIIDVTAENWIGTVTRTPLYSPGKWGIAE